MSRFSHGNLGFWPGVPVAQSSSPMTSREWRINTPGSKETTVWA
jgi:hypothetical protein